MKFLVTNRFYQWLSLLVVSFIIGYYVAVVFLFAKLAAGVLFVLTVVDLVLLFLGGKKLDIQRQCNERFSNGDDNEVTIRLESSFAVNVKVEVIDELPVQFQIRDFSKEVALPPGEVSALVYTLRPVTRGVYAFGYVIGLVTTPIGLMVRKVKGAEPQEVKVYPSFIKIHQYELMAISQNLTLQGQKQVRKIGNSKEFDTIKDYVFGDDPRNINWAATARRGHLMTNHYIDERAQNVYCLIDKSRAMKMPFEGMTLLDYAINASLVMSNVALKKGDLAGLISFEHKVDTSVKASNRGAQIYQIMEALYHQDTSFDEPDFASLYTFTTSMVNQRSLLLLFTNFESIHSLERQMPYLKMLSRKHLVLLTYFRNTEVDKLLKTEAVTTREIYDQAIARQMLEEKLLIRTELSKAGILSLYTTPQNLNVDVINKYIEVKAKRML